MNLKSSLIRSAIPLTCTFAIVAQFAGSNVVVAADSYKTSSSGTNAARTAIYVAGGATIAYFALTSGLGGTKPATTTSAPEKPLPTPTPTPTPAPKAAAIEAPISAPKTAVIQESKDAPLTTPTDTPSVAVIPSAPITPSATVVP